MIGYGAHAFGADGIRERTFYDPVSAAIIVGTVAFGVGGVIKARRANREYEQQTAALEQDIGTLEMQYDPDTGEGRITDDAERQREQITAQQELEAQLREQERLQLLDQAGDRRDLAVAQISAQRDLGLQHAGESLARTESRLLTQRNLALVDVGLQQRGTQIQAAQQREDIMVASEQALGVTQAQIAASGLRGGQGSAAVLAAQTEANYNTQEQRVLQNLSQAELLFSAANTRVGAQYQEGVADANLAYTQTTESITQRADQATDSAELQYEQTVSGVDLAADQTEQRMDLQVEQAVSNIDAAEQAGIDDITNELDWLDSQLEYGESIQQQVQGEAFLYGGVQLAGAAVSFF